MTMQPRKPRSPRRLAPLTLSALLLAAQLSGCGGGNPVGNPPDVSNPAGAGGQKLAFAYFQYCIQPLLVTPITSPQGGSNTCASGGCHSNINGTGGALRITDPAASVNLSDPANTPAVIRTTDMYKNYYSSLGVTIPGDALQSRLLDKPLLLNVLHGGGQILASEQDTAARLITYWINHPAPQGQDEFGTATYSMFTPALDPANPGASTCNLP
ncbi:MAG: hypothetical protein KA375_07480 [Vitreoscilla sp.]|nr:hypothetical protein [Vitreoscilla sp.]